MRRNLGHVETLSTLDLESGLRANDVVEIVHDLKNPLATIALEMCLLADKLGDAAPVEMRGAVTRVQHNVAYLDRLVQDILDSCALDAGSFELQRRPSELHALLEQVIDRSVATRDRGRVYFDVRHRLTLEVDGLRIQRVVANLLQNALKYAPRATGVIVRLEVGMRARISVIDAGPGMTADEMSHVFAKYWRTTDAVIHEGSGLGLYVAKRIIEAHGGTIGVESVLDRGSKFFFELPLTQNS
jgi:two-component system, OmpR family, sensor histidine kinase BaeS